MNEAHVFQHKYTGVQIFVYHCNDEIDARYKFINLVISYSDWEYLGKKVANNV